MAFGLSFGSKKAKTDMTSTVNKLEDALKSGTETTTGTKVGSTTQATSQSGTSTGTSATTNTQTGTTSTTGTQQTQQTSRTLGENITSGIEGAVTSLLSNILNPNTGDRAMLGRGMDAMGGFNVDSFVNGSLMAAKAQEGTKLDEILGSIFSGTGGTEGNNSAATLLAARARDDRDARLAGVQQQATAQGYDILAQNLAATSGAVAAGGQNLVAGLLNALKGAVTTSTGAATTTEAGTQNQTASSQTATTEANQQQGLAQSQSFEAFAQELATMLRQLTQTTGTETQKGKTSEKGGGFSLSL